MSLANKEELLLEEALGPCQLRTVAVESNAQRGAAHPATAEHGFHFPECDESQVLRLGQRAAQLDEAHHARDVQQGPGGWGDG